MGTVAAYVSFWRKIMNGIRLVPEVVFAGSLTGNEDPEFEDVIGGEIPRVGEPTPKSKR